MVGHGQMGERELEKVMLKFVRDEADVLVSTTIIENGLDIPRANTIIVNRADRFGLSELYQLRGRVGRSNQRAYAYLLVPPEASLTPMARRRLAALREFSELGAGFRIAALDLELRGAGNLLGREQHGHIAAIGFDLYAQMLERAVSAKKGEAEQPELRATLNLGMDIRIPPEYHAQREPAIAHLQADRRNTQRDREGNASAGTRGSIWPASACHRQSIGLCGPEISVRAAANLICGSPRRMRSPSNSIPTTPLQPRTIGASGAKAKGHAT